MPLTWTSSSTLITLQFVLAMAPQISSMFCIRKKFLYLKLFGVDESIYSIMSSVCHVSCLVFCLRVSSIWFLCKFLSFLFLLYLILGFFIDHFLICVLKLLSSCHFNLCICKSYSHYSLRSLNISIIASLKSLLCIWAV